MTEPPKERWRFTKEISIATLLALIGAFSHGIWRIAALEAEVARLKDRDSQIIQQVDNQQRILENSIQELKSLLIRLDDKVERRTFRGQ